MPGSLQIFIFVDEVTKITNCYVIVYLLFYISKFSSCLSSLAKCKNRTHGNENHTTYFWYFGSFDEKTNLPKWHEININQMLCRPHYIFWSLVFRDESAMFIYVHINCLISFELMWNTFKEQCKIRIFI